MNQMIRHDYMDNVLCAALRHMTSDTVVRGNLATGCHLVEPAIVKFVTTQTTIAVIHRRFGCGHLSMGIMAGQTIQFAVAGYVAPALPQTIGMVIDLEALGTIGTVVKVQMNEEVIQRFARPV